MSAIHKVNFKLNGFFSIVHRALCKNFRCLLRWWGNSISGCHIRKQFSTYLYFNKIAFSNITGYSTYTHIFFNEFLNLKFFYRSSLLLFISQISHGINELFLWNFFLFSFSTVNFIIELTSCWGMIHFTIVSKYLCISL